MGTGIDIDIFKPDIDEDTVKKNDFKRLIYVGKLSNAKGVPQLLDAYEGVCKESNKKYELLIVGSGKGIERDQIIKKIETSSCNIKYLGQLDQKILSNYLRTSDLFILPSYYEGIPLVLLEAMACGCMGIVTDLPGLKQCLQEVCGNLENIEYIPMPKLKTVDEPADEEISLFIENIKFAIKKQLGKSERPKSALIFDKIKTGFGWDSIFKKYLKIYDSLIE